MRLLALSWRYIDHPAAGGAEVVTHEVLRRLAAQLDEVACFTASHPGASGTDTIDGVQLHRRGHQATVHYWAWRWLRNRIDRYDRVLDQINTIPFFTPLYVPEGKRFFFIHQLAREYWWRETRGLFRLGAPFGYASEPAMLRLYRGTPGLTVSESTRADLAAVGIPRDHVTVVPQALSARPLDDLADKPPGPLRLISVGRVTPAKFVEEGIRAYAHVVGVVPDARLDVVGGGDPAYQRRLERLCKSLGLDGVEFHGRVDGERKHELLQRAHVHVFTSHREGWGLVVSEAGAMGTPSVGYDVPGVRDSIADPLLLAPRGDVRALAENALSLWRDPHLYARMRSDAWERSRGMSPDATTRAFAAALGLPYDF